MNNVFFENQKIFHQGILRRCPIADLALGEQFYRQTFNDQNWMFHEPKNKEDGGPAMMIY